MKSPFLIFAAAVLMVPAGWNAAFYSPVPLLSPWLMALSLTGLCLLVRTGTGRRAFYGGLMGGLAIMVPHLWFLQGIFSWIAVALWLLLAVWHGLFAATLHWLAHRPGIKAWCVIAAAPVLWMGFEFYRSEVWGLRFAWLTTGFALPAEHMGRLFGIAGVYGAGAVLMLAAATAMMGRSLPVRAGAAVVLPGLLVFPRGSGRTPEGFLTVSGVQCENASHERLLSGLDRALAQAPDTELFVLPEYSFQGAVPQALADWCRIHQRRLIAGGTKDVIIPAAGGKPPQYTYYNTAWVVGPDGSVVHEQAKSMPIQFFADGLPALSRKVWSSPWGRVGICICYDQSYRRVTDDIAQQEMVLLCVPTMDLESWGEHQHELSMRLGVTRAAEYAVPVVRVASSGISIFTDATGRKLATAPFAGQNEIVSARIPLTGAARIPLDRWPAEISAWLALATATVATMHSFTVRRRELARKRRAA